MPKSITDNTLKSWTEVGDEDAKRFAGAARYTTSVTLPAPAATQWILDLGDVRESARVRVKPMASE